MIPLAIASFILLIFVREDPLHTKIETREGVVEAAGVEAAEIAEGERELAAVAAGGAGDSDLGEGADPAPDSQK
jgi:hypothetical protein